MARRGRGRGRGNLGKRSHDAIEDLSDTDNDIVPGSGSRKGFGTRAAESSPKSMVDSMITPVNNASGKSIVHSAGVTGKSIPVSAGPAPGKSIVQSAGVTGKSIPVSGGPAPGKSIVQSAGVPGKSIPASGAPGRSNTPSPPGVLDKPTPSTGRSNPAVVGQAPHIPAARPNSAASVGAGNPARSPPVVPDKPTPSTGRSNPAVVGQAPHIPAAQPNSAAPFGAEKPMNARLMAAFGGFDNVTLSILEAFFDMCVRLQNESVAKGLFILSKGMSDAVESYREAQIKNDETKQYLEFTLRGKDAAERMRDALYAENNQLKVSLGLRDQEISVLQTKVANADAEFKSRNDACLEIKNELQKKDAAIADLQLRLKKSESDTARAISEFTELRTQFDREKFDLELRIEELQTRDADLQRIAELHASAMARFADMTTGVKRRCPLILNNGVIQSLDAVIGVWTQEADLGQVHSFRMFTCPVTKSISTLSPFPILDTFMKLAGSIGIDTTSPIVFSYRVVGGDWIEFTFHEQLELIARLCSVYKDRENTERQPDQRSVSIRGRGSALIQMRAVAQGNGFLLECFGMRNDGSGRVDIRVVLDPSWTHPFNGMEFPSND